MIWMTPPKETIGIPEVKSNKICYNYEKEFLTLYTNYKYYRVIGVKWAIRFPESKDLNIQVKQFE